MRSCRRNQSVVCHYWHYDTDGYTKLSGQVGTHSSSLWLNSAVSAVSVTLAEISGGDYKATFTPNAVGLWEIEVAVPHGSSTLYWGESVECRETDLDSVRMVYPPSTGMSVWDEKARNKVLRQLEEILELLKNLRTGKELEPVLNKQLANDIALTLRLGELCSIAESLMGLSGELKTELADLSGGVDELSDIVTEMLTDEQLEELADGE